MTTLQWLGLMLIASGVALYIADDVVKFLIRRWG
jgi:hypothetical protein